MTSNMETAMESDCQISQRHGLVDYADSDTDSDQSEANEMEFKEQPQAELIKTISNASCHGCLDKVESISKKGDIANGSGVIIDNIPIWCCKDCGLWKDCECRNRKKHTATDVPKSDYPCEIKRRKVDNGESNMNHLQVPSSIKSMFKNSSHKWTDNPDEHGGRIRSFAHVDGDWATHVFIGVQWSEELFALVSGLIENLNHLPFVAMQEFHLSLSRTVPIRHHWIQPLVESLREKFAHLKTTVCELSNIKLFTNDEKTRTFLCLEVSDEEERATLREYMKAVDICFDEFKLPKYYENPSFHVSLAWCLGDVTGCVSATHKTQIKTRLGEFLQQNSEQSIVYASEILCRSGNKHFTIPLLEKG